MIKKIKIVIINHTFQKEQFYKRWKLLAEKYQEFDITLLAPKVWNWGEEKNLTYGHVDTITASILEEDRFRIKLIDINKNWLGGWTSNKMVEHILDICPDIVYYIGEHRQDSLHQLLQLKKKLTNTKFVAFSMRGHQQSLKLKLSKKTVYCLKNIAKYFYYLTRLRTLNKYCDAIFCHYPDALLEFRKENYKNPIYIQTQVGVDAEIFYPDEQKRKRIREKYNIGNSYLFGSASRFNNNKGLLEIINALPKEGDWKYLMMGWGRPDEVQKIKDTIQERNLEDKIILTGYIETWEEMSQYWNALDCAVHAPLTSDEWEETFSLALVQAMATGLPVIGSSSGSVPYQIGPDGIIVEEKNLAALREQFVKMINTPDFGKAVGKKMKLRVLNCFEIRYLNDLFYKTVLDIINNVYDKEKIDMTNFKQIGDTIKNI